MKRIAVVGVYGVGDDFTTGQAVKCYTLINWFVKKYGSNNVQIVNTYKWKKSPIKLFIELLIAMRNCNNIIIMPAQHGVKIFAPLIYYLNKLFHRKIHYIVIGGWLAEMLSKKPWLKKCIRGFNGIHVETNSMKKSLEEFELSNIYYMPNSREFNGTANIKKHISSEVVPICTYSRVIKEKGIEDAVSICKKANASLNKKRFKLDIYGKVAQEYEEELKLLVKKNKDFVTYCGAKSPDITIDILLDYFVLLFPTFYEGEGFAGTVLDAFASGTPIIANDWKYNAEIITDGQDGYVYPFRNIEYAAEHLIELYSDDELYKVMQQNCRKSAYKYDTNLVMEEFTKMIE